MNVKCTVESPVEPHNGLPRITTARTGPILTFPFDMWQKVFFNPWRLNGNQWIIRNYKVKRAQEKERERKPNPSPRA